MKKTTTRTLCYSVLAVSTLTFAAQSVASALQLQQVEQLLQENPANDSVERYIVTYKPVEGLAQASSVLSGEASAQRVLKQKGVSSLKYLQSISASVVEADLHQVKALLKDPSVASVEVDAKRYLFELTPAADSVPYGITMVQANQVSDANASNTKVCVIDTGYRLGHVDLPNTGVTGYAFSGHGSWNTDGNGHGTHVAGTMVALSNGQGVVGVLPSGQAGVHIVKIFNDAGNWTYASDLIQGIESCRTAGAKVVNMSLGGSSSSAAEETAMNNFYNGGMLLVAAAGNGGNTALSYPASYNAVVSVAAVDSSRNLASFSQRNAQVELAGPGVAVNSTWNNGGYNSISGTSMASPHVAAVAALVWSNHPSCTAAQIRAALNATAQDRGTTGRDTSFGFGIVQAKAAHDRLTANGCSGGGDPGTPPGGGATFPNLSATTGNWLRGSYTIPAGVSSITFTTSGGTGDVDLYVRFGSAPTLSTYTCRPYRNGNAEQCVINNPQAGVWHVGLHAYSSFSGVTFSYQY